MSKKYFNVLENRQDLTTGETSKIFVSLPHGGTPISHEFSYSAAANTIPLSTTDDEVTIDILTPASMTGVTLREGTPFIFESTTIYLAQEVLLVGGTTESLVFDVQAGISILAGGPFLFDLIAYIPFYSADNFTFNINGNSLRGQVFSGGAIEEVINNTIAPEASTSGPRVFKDSGGNIVRSACIGENRFIDVTMVRAGLAGGFFFTTSPTENSETSARTELVQTSSTMPITRFDEFTSQKGIIDWDDSATYTYD